MDIRLIVNAIELAQATANMNRAMEIYNDAIDAVRSAADDLASKWEGDTKEAFVQNQAEAYNWYSSIRMVVMEIIDLVKKVIDLYNETEERVKGIMQG